MADQDFPGAGVDQVPFQVMRSERMMTVKGSIDTIGVRQRWRPHLENFVRLHHKTTMHTYRLLKLILMHLILTNDFDASEHIGTAFIAEVYQKLIRKGPRRRRPEEPTQRRRAIIDHFLPRYLQDVGIGTVGNLDLMLHAQQTSRYEALKIKTAYLNNVRNNFGNRLRQAVNVLLDLANRKRALRQQLQRQHVPPPEIARIIRENITNRSTEFKLALAQRTTAAALIATFGDGPDGIYTRAINRLEPMLTSYRAGTRFAQNNIYYDCKANPATHFKAFFRLAQLFQNLEVRPFCVFPLRRSFVPGYVIMDTKIVITKIFQRTVLNNERLLHHREWSNFVNFDLPIFRGQGIGGRRVQFGNMIQTDGVGVSVLKRGNFDVGFNPEQAAGQGEAPEFPYITAPGVLPRDNCVVVDPGRRDLLYCMHENSTVDNPNMFRFTKPMQDKIRKNRRYRLILQQLKPQNISDLERTLINSNSLVVGDYRAYLRNFGRACGTLLGFYARTRGLNNLEQFPIHRKLRLSAVLKKQRCDQLLVRFLQNKFPGATYIMGNWSAPHARFHEPIRGKGFRRLLDKNGMNVLLVDEYLTSQVCPECHERTLGTFRQRRNPRPWRRAANPQVTVHGQLRCTNRFNQGHRNAARWEYRYWNRDTAATMNMVRIVNQARIDGQRPPDLERPRRGPQAPA